MSRIALFSIVIMFCQPLLAALAPASHAHILHSHQESHASAAMTTDSAADSLHDCCDEKTSHPASSHSVEYSQDNTSCCDDNCQCSIGCQLSLITSVTLPQQPLAQTKLSSPAAALPHVPPTRRLRPPIHLTC